MTIDPQLALVTTSSLEEEAEPELGPSYADENDVREVVRYLVQDPITFVKGILGHKIWHRQKQILRSVADNSRTSVKACHASSKTFTAAEVALWWVTNFEDGIVITTAPVFKQVRLVMWGEIHRMIRGCHLVQYPYLNQTELRISEDNYLIGISTDAGVNLQGFHGKILIILDEAVGIANDIHEAIEGIRAGGDVRILALGNPTVPGGWFYESFQPTSVGWSNITISAFDSPNLVHIEPTVECTFHVPGVTNQRHKDILATILEMDEDELNTNPWPFLTSRQWVKEKWLEWGTSDNPLWYSRVLGLFPPQADNALISLTWVEQARWAGQEEVKNKRRRTNHEQELVDVGIDVAGPGDDETVVTVVSGPKVLGQWVWRDPDPRPGVTQLLMEWAHRIRSVKVDSNGIGYGLFLHLVDAMEAWPDIEIIGVNVGAGAFDKLRFANLKAELYWYLRERFQMGTVWGLEDETLRGQLLSILYHIRANGQTIIESKDEARKRGVKSPDRAESLMLAFAPLRSDPNGELVFLSEHVSISPV